MKCQAVSSEGSMALDDTNSLWDGYEDCCSILLRVQPHARVIYGLQNVFDGLGEGRHVDNH